MVEINEYGKKEFKIVA